MQACQVCGAAEVDVGGHCTGCFYEPAPSRGHLGPLFLLTVMVAVLVIGAVSVVLIRTDDRGAEAAAPAPPTTASPSGPPSASAVVDRCVVGDWAVTSAVVRYDGLDLTTTAGGLVHLLAGGTGAWDFGSGITLTGTIEGQKSEDLVTGRVDFTYRTVGQAFTFQDVRNDVREVVMQGRNKPVNRKAEFAFGAAEYTCAGAAMRLTFGAWDMQMGRK